MFFLCVSCLSSPSASPTGHTPFGCCLVATSCSTHVLGEKSTPRPLELTHWKRLWCWEGLGAGGEGDDRGWDGWVASLTRWTWVWVNSGNWWWTGRPGVLRFMGSQRVGHDWATELNWTEAFGEGNGTPLQYSCLENPLDGGAWWAAVHEVAKSRTRLSDFTLTFHFHELEKEMETHSRVLAWRILGTGDPGGRPSMGSHRVGHNWSDLAAAAAGLSYHSYCDHSKQEDSSNWSRLKHHSNWSLKITNACFYSAVVILHHFSATFQYLSFSSQENIL